MLEYEPFDNFYLWLSMIVNQAPGIGCEFDDLVIMRKIIRVLPCCRFG